MNTFANYLKLFKFFVNSGPKAFLILLLVASIESFVSLLTIVAVAPFADFLADTSLKNVNQITSKIIQILEFFELKPSLEFFGFLFITFNLLRSCSEIILRFITLKLKYSLIGKVNTELISNLLHSKYSYSRKLSKGKIVNTITRETNLVGDTFGIFSIQIASALKFFVLVTFPIVLFPTFMFFLLLTLLSATLPYLLIQKYNLSLGKESTGTSNQVIESLSELIRSIKPIKSYLKENAAVATYKSGLLRHFHAAIKSHTLSFATYSSYQTLGIAAVTISTIIYDTLLISEMAVIIWSMLQALPVASRVLSSHSSIINYYPAFEQVVKINDGAVLYAEHSVGRQLTEVNSIRLSEISYSEGEKSILNAVNLEIKKGKVIAICGVSGSGKSTLLDIIMGFLTPTNGTVYFDGVKSEEYNIHSVRGRISYCSQDSILVSGSIRDNLKFANPNCSDEEYIKALKIADATKLIKKGLDFDLGEFGQSLSGGEKQKLALARALVKKNDILILDEITASIDTTSEHKIYSSLVSQASERITILVTHNTDCLIYADQIFILNNGAIIDFGTYETLSKTSSFYMNSLEK